MTHALEDLLTLQYGPAKLIRSEALAEQRWNVGEKLRECTLFKTLSWDDQLRRKYGVLEKLYGDSKGGFLLGDSLKVALIEGPGVFGLHLIDELRSQEAVIPHSRKSRSLVLLALDCDRSPPASRADVAKRPFGPALAAAMLRG